MNLNNIYILFRNYRRDKRATLNRVFVYKYFFTVFPSSVEGLIVNKNNNNTKQVEAYILARNKLQQWPEVSLVKKNE
ncbi:MAG TPA: hypothetical protein VIP70_03855 [Nitrososphaeraceae archaeon]